MKGQGMKYGLLLILYITLHNPFILSGQNMTKRGGVGFRIDENPPLNKIHSYDSLFSRFGQKYSFAVTSYVLPLVPAYVDTLRALSQRGVELMDNTPTHATQFFNVLNYQDTNLFRNKPGVDHINNLKICLKYISCDTTTSHGEGFINVFGNKVISYTPGEFHDLLPPSPYFAVFLSAPINRLCLLYNIQSSNISDPDTLYIKSFWDETISLPNQWYFHYHKILNYNVVMHDSALKILGKRSVDIFSNVNLERPNSWVQPAEKYPWISPVKLKAILGSELNYKLANSFINSSLFCYNEYNPQGIKQYAINSQAIDMESGTFHTNKHIIANAIAKHYVLFDVSRLINAGTSWHAYLHRMDSLLSWCSSRNIPIRTYSKWKSMLYDSIPPKTVDIFPKLNVDIDSDNWPDGFDHDPSINGIYEPVGGFPSGNGLFKTYATGGTLCRVLSLTGLEKRTNVLTLYTKGQGKPGSNITAWIQFPEVPQTVSIQVPSETTTWQQHSLLVNVPDAANLANIWFTTPGTFQDTVRISGIGFRSSGFLSMSAYPLQVQTANNLFPVINLNSLVVDTTPISSLTWTFKGNHHMRFTVDSLGNMKSRRPVSFWVGLDSVYAIARKPDMLSDSCLFKFRSDTVPQGCAGQSISISILDTITSSDYIVWTSTPHDSTMTDTTVFNPTVSPKITTKYHVQVYNLYGNTSSDSITIIRHDYPVPGLFSDSTICEGNSIVLTAQGGVHYWWSNGDTTASITVRPDTTTRYTVQVTNQWHCSADDTTLINVEKLPVVTLSGLLPQYCSTDTCVLMVGTPWYGQFHGSSGVTGSLFCPKQARIGRDTIWFSVTSPRGCYNADTVFTNVNPAPVTGLFKDSTICQGRRIVLTASGGVYYLWSTQDTTASITVSPDTSTTYKVHVTNQWNCSADDSSRISVEKIPVVKLSGLVPQYCAIDTCYQMHGIPGNGKYGGSIGVVDSTFCPQLAATGKDTVWYQLTTLHGCYNADTVFIVVNVLPVIPKLPDTNLYADRRIYLNAGPGNDNYLWSNGATTQTTVVDSVHHGLGLLKVWVIVTKESCVSTDTARINFIKNPSSVLDLGPNTLITVFPNPAAESISIIINENTGSADEARLFNSQGKLITSATVRGKITHLPVTDVQAGIYILLLRHNDREYYIKVVKL